MELAEIEFTNFFQNLDKQGFCACDKIRICKTFYRHKYLKNVKCLCKIICVLVILCLAWHTFDCISWFVSAILRVILIQMLPYWNWTSIYDSKCLIERNAEMNVATSSASDTPGIAATNCLLCATMENIPTTSNVTFGYLEWEFLDGGLPIIVTDSHEPKPLNVVLENIWNYAPNLVNTEPCDVATNLMLNDRFNIELALQKMNTSKMAYLQFRNCRMRAVKWSRLLITKPYYYPVHLKPYHSSWFIMSRNYVVQKASIYVQGLILVQQWQGFIGIRLKPKQPCGEKDCPNIDLRLTAGEALIFTTDLWDFNYSLDKQNNCLTSILEIDWQI